MFELKHSATEFYRRQWFPDETVETRGGVRRTEQQKTIETHRTSPTAFLRAR